jgi:hypothetical protein
MNYYDLLSVPPQATPEQIRTAYRTLAQIYHPDRLAHLKPEARQFAEERFKALNQAYGVLSDPGKRASYDLTLQQPPPLARAAMPTGQAPAYRPPAEPVPGSTPGAAKRAQVLERRQRLARLEAEIIDLSRNVSALETERVRARVRAQNLHSRNVLRFWVGTLLTALLFNSVLAITVGLFALPPTDIHPTLQRVVLVLVVALYEYWAALTISYLCRVPGARVNQWATMRVTLWGLAVAWPVGLLGWGLWQWAFAGVLATPLSALGLIGIYLVGHIVFCLVAVGYLPRVARDQQRVLEHTYTPMLQAYEHQLTQLRAQKAVLEAETA